MIVNKMIRDENYIDLINESGEMKLALFLKNNGISRNRFMVLYRQNLITINKKIARRNDSVVTGDVITITIDDEFIPEEPIDLPIEILYEDADYIVLNKPTNLTMNTKGEVSLANIVSTLFKKRLLNRKVRFVNRLDQDTSGVVIVAKNPYAQSYLQGISMIKKYWCIVEGCLVDHEAIIDVGLLKDDVSKRYIAHSDGKPSLTKYRVIKRTENTTLVEVELLTGRSHQIRAHFAHLGHPVLGDKLYGSIQPAPRQMLHAYFYRFSLMRSKEVIEVSAPLPEDMKQAFDFLD